MSTREEPIATRITDKKPVNCITNEKPIRINIRFYLHGTHTILDHGEHPVIVTRIYLEVFRLIPAGQDTDAYSLWKLGDCYTSSSGIPGNAMVTSINERDTEFEITLHDIRMPGFVLRSVSVGRKQPTEHYNQVMGMIRENLMPIREEFLGKLYWCCEGTGLFDATNYSQKGSVPIDAHYIPKNWPKPKEK